MSESGALGALHIPFPACHLRPGLIERVVYERRIEQLEQHVERFISLIQKPDQSQTDPHAASTQTASGAEMDTAAEAEAEAEVEADAEAQDPTPIPNPFLSSPSTSVSPTQRRDVISTNQISLDEAELLLQTYRAQLADNFPYVVITEEMTLPKLRRHSPMLLLAILVTASWRDRPRQEVLNREYLRLLSDELIVQGSRDLDLLQGLMVFLNWYVGPRL